ncbi:hypothetical protein [Streptomyces goshikiensis]|uniref:hypothetical protein n=1 Tax=Streptomyces goshikiensis TaxID=1942 RepID=UPI00368F4E5A
METALSIIAIIVSVGTAVSEAIRWKAEGAKLAVTASTAMVGPFETGEMRSCVCVRVVNSGRGTVVIRDWGLIHPNSTLSTSTWGKWSHGPATPVVLSPENPDAFWKLDLHEQRQSLEAEHPGVPLILQAFVRLPGGKMVRSTNQVAIDGSSSARPTWQERWNRWRDAQVFVGAYRPGQDGNPHRLVVTGSGPRAARRVIVDLVRDRDGTARGPIPPGAQTDVRRRTLRKGKDLAIAIPEPAYGEGLHFRVRWQSWRRHHEVRSELPDRSILDAAAEEFRRQRQGA